MIFAILALVIAVFMTCLFLVVRSENKVLQDYICHLHTDLERARQEAWDNITKK